MDGGDLVNAALVVLVLGAFVLGRSDGGGSGRDAARGESRHQEDSETQRLQRENDLLRERLEQANWRTITADQSLAVARSRAEDMQNQVWAGQKRLAAAQARAANLEAAAAQVRDIAAAHDREADRLEAEAAPFGPESIERLSGLSLARDERERAERLRAALEQGAAGEQSVAGEQSAAVPNAAEASPAVDAAAADIAAADIAAAGRPAVEGEPDPSVTVTDPLRAPRPAADTASLPSRSGSAPST